MATSTFDPARHPGAGPIPEFALVFETADAPANITTTYSMNVGDTFSGRLSSSTDADWVAVTLTAGERYQIDLEGRTLSDPYLYLYDGNGRLISVNDDGGAGRDSQITYTATSTGTYYLRADAYSTQTGSYRLTVETVQPATPGTLDQMANYLTDGYWNDTGRGARRWDTSSDNVITVDLSGLTAQGKQLARWAFEAWEMVANLDFQEVTSGANITFDDNEPGAFATVSLSGGFITSAQVNVSSTWLTNDGASMDSYSFSTYIHEIGHALGLGHQGNYNGNARYGQDETFSNDSWQLSIMSYFSQSDNTTVNASRALHLSVMPVDVIAIQNIYGAPTDLTGGNTTWGANSSLGNYMDQYFATVTGTANSSVNTGDAVAFTIYDRDGIDTLNTSFSDRGDRIDLNSGAFSDVNNLIGNIGIARGTIVENATTGDGNDVITGNWAGNIINSNGGNDRIDVGLGWDKVWSGAGADTVLGGNGNDTIGGMNGNDQLWGGANNDRIFGGNDNDTIGGGTGDDQLFGDNGDDIVWGNAGDDTVRGGAGHDRLFGGDNSDLIYGDSGEDTLYGGNGADTLLGGGWSDLLDGEAGNDQIWGENGNDTLWGGAGNDTLGGGEHNDAVDGGLGDDLLYGGNGNDTLSGGWGDDTLNGHGGNDRLIFGVGNDVADGGWGADTFVFHGNFGSSNTINNFLVSQGDRIELDDALWIVTHGTLSAAQVLSNFAATVGSDLVLSFDSSHSFTLAGLGTATGLDSVLDIV